MRRRCCRRRSKTTLVGSGGARHASRRGAPRQTRLTVLHRTIKGVRNFVPRPPLGRVPKQSRREALGDCRAIDGSRDSVATQVAQPENGEIPRRAVRAGGVCTVVRRLARVTVQPTGRAVTSQRVLNTPVQYTRGERGIRHGHSEVTERLNDCTDIYPTPGNARVRCIGRVTVRPYNMQQHVTLHRKVAAPPLMMVTWGASRVCRFV